MLFSQKEKNMSTLCMDRGGETISPKDLGSIPCPDGTSTWKPISHVALRYELLKSFEDLGWDSPVTEEWGISSGRQRRTQGYTLDPHAYTGRGARAFGLLTFRVPGCTKEYDLAVGARNSLDKSLAIGLCFGASVFICENLALCGDQVYYRRHTSRLDLAEASRIAVGSIAQKYRKFLGFTDSLRGEPLHKEQVHAIVWDTIKEGLLPGSLPQVIVNAWEGRHGEIPGTAFYLDGVRDRVKEGMYAEPDAWSLHGLYTDAVFRRLDPTAASNALTAEQGTLNKILCKHLPHLTPYEEVEEEKVVLN